jgi:hypothetical protein
LASFGEAVPLVGPSVYSWRNIEKHWLWSLLGGSRNACLCMAHDHASVT